MRTKIVIAILATAISMSSCEWISPSKNLVSSNQIEGKWKVDSLTEGNDTSSLFPLLLAMAATDGNNNVSMQIEFNKDSIITTYAGGDSDTTYFINDTLAKIIYFKEDSTNERISYRFIKHNVMYLQLKDSTVLHLSKK